MVLSTEERMTDTGATWSSKDFCQKLHVGEIKNGGSIHCVSKGFGNHSMVIVNFYNVPTTSGGATAENNRAMFTIEGFGNKEGEPSPTGKVKLKTSVWSFGHEPWNVKRPRGMTASPAKVLQRLVTIIRNANNLEPKVEKYPMDWSLAKWHNPDGPAKKSNSGHDEWYKNGKSYKEKK
jgi:hypothetical protein